MPATNHRLLGTARFESAPSDGLETTAISADVSGGGVYLDRPTFAQATGDT